MEFKEWVENRYRHPVVMVLASPAVEQACRRNGMDLVQMLRPFSVHPTELYARLGERADATTVRNFGVRLTRVPCVREVGAAQLTRHIRRLLRDNAAMELAYGEQLDRAMSALLRDGGGVVEGPRLSTQTASLLLERSHPAWHSQLIRDYAQLVRCSYFDTIDHPVGCIFAASTSVGGGVDEVMSQFRELQRRPPETRQNMPCMDDDLHRFYLLVHDITEGPPLEEARRMLAAVQAQYGHAYCALVKINAVVNPQDMKSMDPSPWIEANTPSLDVPSLVAVRAAQRHEQEADCRTSTATTGGGSTRVEHTHVVTGSAASSSSTTTTSSISASNNSTPASLQFPRVHTIFGTWSNGVAKVTGCHLSPENVDELRDVMRYYLSQCLFNFIERKLRALTLTVNEKRTTTLSKVAAWFRNKDEVKSKSECWVVAHDGGPTKYLAGSLEMQMRRAADLSLVLADYDSAVSFYRMCRNEAQSTLSSREFNKPIIAACQEGLGVCDLLLGRLPLPSMTPWLTGGTASKSSGDCRLEIAQNDYVSCQVQTHAFRLSLLLFEYCRTRSPPALVNAAASLLHVQRLGMTSKNKLYSAVVHELLASTSLFLNPPHPAGLAIPAPIPNNYPVRSHIRQYARHTIIAGSAYLDENLFESALRCYLRALRVYGGVGRHGDWQLTYEHLHTLLAHMYHKLGNHTRGLALATVAVSMGTPMYSNPRTGLRNFDAFWNRQRQLLGELGYALCPHMAAPCIVPGSIRVSVNSFHCDAVTKQESQMVSDELAEVEWRKMEDKLRTQYTGNNIGFPRHRQNWREGPAKMQQPVVEGCMRRFTMHLAESLEISVTLRNPVGGSLIAEKLCLLYVAKQKPEQLWKSASSQTVELPAGTSKSVTIAFSPAGEGTYVIIGFCWTLMELEGYYYFATEAHKESEANIGTSSSSSNGFSSVAFEYAVDHPKPNVDSPANLEIEVGPPQAWITARLDPELPAVMRDGEYYHTTLVLRNGSAHRRAHTITLQRSPQNAQVVWFETFGLECNMDANATLMLKEELDPKASIKLPLTVQAQHGRDSSSRCRNNVFLLVGCIVETPLEEGGLPAPCSPSSPFPYVRLHRFLRRVVVKPTLLLSSNVLPPGNATMAAAALITTSNVADAREPPVRVSRVMAMHRPRWRVAPTHTGILLEENAIGCIVRAGEAVCVPLSIVNEAAAAMSPKKTQKPATTVPVTPPESGLVEEVCVPLLSAFPAPAKCALVEANIGTSVVDASMNLYFMRCSFRGPGTVGEVQTRSGLSFYLDKAGGSGDSSGGAASKVLGESLLRQQQARHVVASSSSAAEEILVEPFTPICVAVAWVVEEVDGRTCSGQLFHFVDPASFLCSGNPLVSEAHEWMQEHLCDSLIKNRTLHPHHGAVVYHVEVPHTSNMTADAPDSVNIPVTLHCHSLAAHPLLVTVNAEVPVGQQVAQASPSPVPLIFVGKTGCAFLLMPHESHSVSFTACAFAPGIVECNVFQLSAVALRLPQVGGVKWRTGMSRGALLVALEEIGKGYRLERGSSITAATILGGLGNRKRSGSCFSRGHMDDLASIVCGDVRTLVIGHDSAAITRAVFSSSPSGATRVAAAAATQRVDAYKLDVEAYEAQCRDFEDRRSLLLSAATGATGQNVGAAAAVVASAIYRPPARQLATEGTQTTPCGVGVIHTR